MIFGVAKEPSAQAIVNALLPQTNGQSVQLGRDFSKFLEDKVAAADLSNGKRATIVVPQSEILKLVGKSSTEYVIDGYGLVRDHDALGVAEVFIDQFRANQKILGVQVGPVERKYDEVEKRATIGFKVSRS